MLRCGLAGSLQHPRMHDDQPSHCHPTLTSTDIIARPMSPSRREEEGRQTYTMHRHKMLLQPVRQKRGGNGRQSKSNSPRGKGAERPLRRKRALNKERIGSSVSRWHGICQLITACPSGCQLDQSEPGPQAYLSAFRTRQQQQQQAEAASPSRPAWVGFRLQFQFRS
ncbi:hypothetical protein BO70DRAFT_200596 [Aspergillus heteromorphus CBS 117.55]|uniref:Uncharacterized protein n=1 Tax=Aspergillus heteromorphus CBS 117.55 TaxID=1448321 RepID=A0A317WML9_9EURO|nr:uncharacterized protein BO70DRAFT_200596 [Aspergillus heteromorphus CBS 117.55]PWY87704.1 hypothetical protein BO70DRAFT_200596 [Aspergillus heteromorphus CBS 117.55]